MDKKNHYLDKTILNDLRDIMGNDFEPLIHAFIRDADQRLAHLQDAFKSGQAEKLRRSAHMFKGSCLNVGAKKLSGSCRDIENLARDGDVEEAEVMIASLENDLGASKQALIDYLKNMD